jgi:hypothetical protein
LALNAYITRTQQLLHDPNAVFYPQTDLVSYINTARSQIAAEAMCVRVLPPSGPGQNVSVLGQEVYTFASLQPLIQATSPGVSTIMGVITIAVAQGTTLKPVLNQKAWSEFQALYRSYNIGLQNYPTVFAQYGQGASGSVYFWPIPSGVYAMDWDCYCLPIDLTSDTDVEAIPYPWTDAIPYFAAYLAFSNAQRPDDADRMMAQYTMFMQRGTAFSNQLMIPGFYGGPGTMT